MSFMVLTDAEEIRALVPTLKGASVPGQSNDGARLVVRYRAFGERVTPRAIAEAQLAADEHWDMQQYSGSLDRSFRNSSGQLCMTLRVLERQGADGHHCFRTLNLEAGTVMSLVVLSNGAVANGHAQPQKPD